MKKSEIHDENTDIFEYKDVSPSKYSRGDCAIRSISLAIDKPYADVLKELKALGRKMGISYYDRDVVTAYLEKFDWKYFSDPDLTMLHPYTDDWYTVEDFCNIYKHRDAYQEGIAKNIPFHKEMILNCTSNSKDDIAHMVYFKNGKYYDDRNDDDYGVMSYWYKG